MGLPHLLPVDIGMDDPLFFPQRTGHYLSVKGDYRGITDIRPFIGQIAAPDVITATHHPTTALTPSGISRSRR